MTGYINETKDLEIPSNQDLTILQESVKGE